MQELEKQQINDWLSDWLVEAEAASAAREVPRTHTSRDSREPRTSFFLHRSFGSCGGTHKSCSTPCCGRWPWLYLGKDQAGSWGLVQRFSRDYISHISHIFVFFFFNFQDFKEKHAIRNKRNMTVEVSAVRSWSGGTSARWAALHERLCRPKRAWRSCRWVPGSSRSRVWDHMRS